LKNQRKNAVTTKPSRLTEITPVESYYTSRAAATVPPPREDGNWLVSSDLQSRLEEMISAALRSTFEKILAARCSDDEIDRGLREAVGEFFPLYRRRPVVNNKGGGLINDSLCLYVTARLLAPRFIVESGSYKGHSAWLLRQACPQAEIHSFDVDHSQLRHREPEVSYYEDDWMDLDLPSFDPDTALIWFDDHISQARRLREAYDRGFRQALFDDNFPAHNLYATGGAPVPTLAMLTDERLGFGERIVWTRHGKKYSYTYEKEHTFGAGRLIESYLPLPDLTAVTRYSPPSGMTYVRLVA
jgi:hypothetical protein